MREEWKSLERIGCSNYGISSFGRIINLKKKKIGNGAKRSDKYINATFINDNNNKRRFMMHNLVAMFFKENYNEEKTYYHKDQNKANNKVNNLTTKNPKRAFIQKKGRSIYKLDSNHKIITKYDKINEAASKNNIGRTIINSSLKRKIRAGGYYWEYCDIYDSNNLEWIEVTIEGFEAVYVTNTGLVKRKNGVITEGCRTATNYLRISLTPISKNIKRKKILVHRLIAKAFLGDSELEVNHKDRNGLNNNINNLEYLTSSENIQHAYDNSIDKFRNKAVSRVVNQLDKDGNYIASFSSIREAAKQTGASETSICNICNKKKSRITSGGFKWEYA